MLKIYDSSGSFIRSISNYKDLTIESELSTGDKTLSFVYRGKQTDILNEYYVQTQTDRYVVKEVEPEEGTVSYVCRLDLEDLEASMVTQFTAADKTVSEAAALALVGTGWRVSTSITKRRSVQTFKKTPYEILLKIRDAFMCELKFDSLEKTVYFEEQFSTDKGVYFRAGLNLKSVSLTLDSYDYYTRIIPIGKNGLKINEVNDGCEYVENHQYSQKIRTLIWEDTSYEDANALKEDAEGKLSDLSIPKRSYSAQIRDLAKQSATYSILSYSLGDTVWIVDEMSGVKEKQRIVKTVEYPDRPEENEVELSNRILTWEELQEKLKAAADAWEDVTNADGTVNGVYVHGISDGNKVLIQTEVNNNATVQANAAGVAQNTSQIEGVAGELTVVKERVGTLETTYLKATDAQILYATIENLTVTNETIHSLQGDYAEFKSATADELAAQRAVINDLDTTYAKIDLANIQAGSIKTAMIDTGAVQTAQIADGSITDAKIVGLTASKITAGTLNAGVIDVVNLNADNITTGSINGQRIADGAVSIEKLSQELSDTISSAIVNEQVLYALSTSTSEAPSGGWSTDAPDWEDGKYMWQKTVLTYANGSTSESDPTCLSGASGQDGEDATLLRIDSSRGTVFKNNMVSTVLSVVIYHGPSRITDKVALTAEFGSSAYIEWMWQRMDEDRYGIISSDDERIGDDGFSFTLSPADVDTKVTFQCNLIV